MSTWRERYHVHQFTNDRLRYWRPIAALRAALYATFGWRH